MWRGAGPPDKAEVSGSRVIGGRGPDRAVLTFMQVRDLMGEKMTPEFEQGPLEALNLMGAQGWKFLAEREPTSGRMGWVCASLRQHDDAIDHDSYQATQFLMMRRVRNRPDTEAVI